MGLTPRRSGVPLDDRTAAAPTANAICKRTAYNRPILGGTPGRLLKPEREREREVATPYPLGHAPACREYSSQSAFSGGPRAQAPTSAARC